MRLIRLLLAAKTAIFRTVPLMRDTHAVGPQADRRGDRHTGDLPQSTSSAISPCWAPLTTRHCSRCSRCGSLARLENRSSPLWCGRVACASSPANRSDNAAAAAHLTGAARRLLYRRRQQPFRASCLLHAVVPPWLPAPALLVQISGCCGILGGAGMLIPRLRRPAGIGLIALLVAVFPANVQMAAHPQLYADIGNAQVFFSAPLQLVLVAWVWWTSHSQRS